MKFNPDGAVDFLADVFASDRGDIVAGVDVDDCAVVALPDGARLVASTDFLNARTIVEERGLATPEVLARILVMANVSDVVASGCIPRWMLVGMQLDRNVHVEWVHRFSRAILAEASAFGVVVVGGDTKLRASAPHSLCATAIGVVPRGEDVWLRSRACEEDDLWVSGSLGSVAASVAVPESDASPLTHPYVNVGVAERLRAARVTLCASDVSDGLFATCAGIARASRCSVEVDVGAVPVLEPTQSAAALVGVPPWTFAAALGGEFEFLFTSPPSHRDRIESLGCSRIGRIVSGDGAVSVRTSAGASVRLLERVGHSDSVSGTWTDRVRELVLDLARRFDA